MPPTGPSLQWKYPAAGAGINNLPIYANNSIFIASLDGHVYALDLLSGSVMWSFLTGGRLSSSPAIGGKVLYVTSSNRMLYALNASTGSLVFQFALPNAAESSPTVSGNTVLISTVRHDLYAIHAKTGAQLWNVSVCYSYSKCGPAAFGWSPVVFNQSRNVIARFGSRGVQIFDVETGTFRAVITQYVSSYSSLSLNVVTTAPPRISVGPNGEAEICFACSYLNPGQIVACCFPTSYYSMPSLQRASPVWNPQLHPNYGCPGGTLLHAPVFSNATGNPILLMTTASSVQSQLLATSLDDSVQWCAEGITSPPIVVNDVIFVGRTSGIWAISVATGLNLWNYPGATTRLAPSMLSGVVYFGTDNGQVMALAAATGALVWSFSTGALQVISSPILAGGLVLVVLNGGSVIAINGTTAIPGMT